MASAQALPYDPMQVKVLYDVFKEIGKDTIESVLQHCQYDIQKAANLLVKMSDEMINHQAPNIQTNMVGQGSKQNDPYQQIKGFIKAGYKILILMRGLPGSGKSSLAVSILNDVFGHVNLDEFVFSTDAYFHKTGTYLYNPQKLDEAHAWNQNRCFSNMKKAVSPLIIDNTNLELWEMKVYCFMAIKFGYIIEIATPLTPWALDPKILAQKNSHGVDKRKIKDMLDRFEQNVSPPDLCRLFKLEYSCLMPQLRSYPPLRKPPQVQDMNAAGSSGQFQQTQYSTPVKKRAQLPLEYVHDFNVKTDDSTPTKRQTTDLDEVLTMRNEPKTANSTEDLINLLNEHKVEPKQTESISAKQSKDISKQLDENKTLMTQLMVLLMQKNPANGKEQSVGNDKISSTTETKMEVDQVITNETRISTPSSSLADLEEENQRLRGLLTQVHPLDAKQERKITDVEKFMMFLEDTPKTPDRSAPRDSFKAKYEQKKLQSERLQSIFNTKFAEESKPNNTKEYDQKRQSSERFLKETTPLLMEQRTKSPEDLNDFSMQEKSLKDSPTDFVFVEDTTSTQRISQTPEKNKKSSVPKFDSKAWGLAEDALVSWEITSPPACQTQSTEDAVASVETRDQSTGTPNFKNRDSPGSAVVITAKVPEGNALVNEEKKSSYLPSPRRKTTLDKGCMTEEEEQFDLEMRQQAITLTELFPNIPVENMLDVYEKCNRDFNWTVDIISSSPMCYPSTNKDTNQAKNSNQKQADPSFTFDLKDWNLLPTSSDNLQEVEEDSSKKKHQLEEVKQSKKQEMLELKKKLEQNVTIGKEHYSDHVWQIKNAKSGVVKHGEAEKKRESPELMTVDDDTIYVSDDACESGGDEDEVTEDLVELNLGTGMVQQLEGMFGRFTYPENFKPVVQMPESLARQLHALYLESICRQIENQNDYINVQLQEDEDMAMRLQEEERKAAAGTDLKGIMDEELARSLHQKEAEQWKNLSPETLALKLTRQKLHGFFPQVGQNVLDEILAAHNNNYTQTIQAIINSTDQQPSWTSNGENLLVPPISDATLKQMKEHDHSVNKVTDDSGDTTDEVRTAKSYRDAANRHMVKRRELLELAHQHHQKHSYEVASFYRELAQKEYKKADVANQHASHYYIEENSQRGDTLDLHFLYVRGAVASLDLFIDHHISNLKSANKSSKYYFVITGRGKRSERGVSKLKPAVMKRLKQRKVHYTWVNPGMLRIKVDRNLAMSTDLEKFSSN